MLLCVNYLSTHIKANIISEQQRDRKQKKILWLRRMCVMCMCWPMDQIMVICFNSFHQKVLLSCSQKQTRNFYFTFTHCVFLGIFRSFELKVFGRTTLQKSLDILLLLLLWMHINCVHTTYSKFEHFLFVVLVFYE